MVPSARRARSSRFTRPSRASASSSSTCEMSPTGVVRSRASRPTASRSVQPYSRSVPALEHGTRTSASVPTTASGMAATSPSSTEPAGLSPSRTSAMRVPASPDRAGANPNTRLAVSSRGVAFLCFSGGYARRVPGPAPPVVHGLQIDQALRFQQRFGRVQRVAWWLLALVPVAAIAGLFGDGLFSEVTAGSERAGGTVTYERFGRLSADTTLELEFARPAHTTEVAISRAFFDRYDTSEVRPQPLRVRTLPDAVVFTFAAAPAGRATFFLQPDAVGSSSGTVTVTGGAPLRIKQLVYP